MVHVCILRYVNILRYVQISVLFGALVFFFRNEIWICNQHLLPLAFGSRF